MADDKKFYYVKVIPHLDGLNRSGMRHKAHELADAFENIGISASVKWEVRVGGE